MIILVLEVEAILAGRKGPVFALYFSLTRNSAHLG